MSDLKQDDIPTILLVDDDLDDCFLITEAMAEAQINHPLKILHNGKELVDYLQGHVLDVDIEPESLPGLILLDLNMPVMDGRKALWKIKQDQRLKKLPIVIFTTSNSPVDIEVTYSAGASGFMTKPARFQDLVSLLKGVVSFWFGLVALPDLSQD